MAVKKAGGRPPNRRQIAAAATRREVLSAARRLFAELGYANTSIQQIAAESGVAVQTIYSSVGSKAALVLALNDLIDEESGVAELAAELGAVTEPADLVAKGVHITRQLNERCGDLIRVLLSAEVAEPAVATAVADGLDRHRRGVEAVVSRLGSLRALAPGTSSEHAAVVFAMMTAPASWRQLTVDAGWGFGAAETFLTDALQRLLLRDTGRGR